MMFPRRARTFSLTGVLCAAVALTGCSASTAGSGSAGSGTAGRAAGSSPAGPATSPAASRPASRVGSTVTSSELAARMRKGSAAVTSAHLSLSIGVGGQTITASGDQRLAAGTIQSEVIDETIPDLGPLTVLIIGRTVYVKLPPSMATGDKPWFRVTPSSSNRYVRSFAASIDSLLGSASLHSFSAFASAAEGITVVGPSTVGGVATTEYSLTIDIAHLPADFPNRTGLQRTGLTTLPVHLWLDGQDRPVRITERITAQGTSASTDIRISDYGKPVTISPPPADQIAAD